MAQVKTEKYTHEQLEIYLKAQEHFESHEFVVALDLFEKLDSMTGMNEHNYEIGMCYFSTRHWEEAEELFAPFIETKHDYPSGLDFCWAVLKHYDHDFVTAKVFYSNYLSRLSHSKLHYNEIVKDIKHRIYLCDVGVELLANKREVDIHNLGDEFNTEYLDYGPVWDVKNDIIVFTSERPSTTGGKLDLTDGTYNEDIYYVKHSANKEWDGPQLMHGGVDTESNESALAISEDGDKILVYKYVREHFFSQGSGDIYEGVYIGESITDLKKLPKRINTHAWESGATYVGKDALIYCSDHKGGYGSSDLYLVEKNEKGEWGEPKNLGGVINTEFEEDSPYLSADGKVLFFASKGHKNMGGFDIFYSRKKDGEWSEPVNLGYPINTAHDEMYFSLSADLKAMYLSSDRKGGHGDQDIYFIEMKKGTFLLD